MPKFFQDRGSTIAPHIPPVFTVVLLHTVASGKRLFIGNVTVKRPLSTNRVTKNEPISQMKPAAANFSGLLTLC